MHDLENIASGIPGFHYADLYAPGRLSELYREWERRLAASDAGLHARYAAYRDGGAVTPEEVSQILIDTAPHVGAFVAQMFGLVSQRDAERARTTADLVVFRFKDEFVKRRALKRTVAAEVAHEAIHRGASVLAHHGLAASQHDDEAAVARLVCSLLDREADLKKRAPNDPELVAVREELLAVADWLIARREQLSHTWISYHFPHTLDFEQLVTLRRPDDRLPEAMVGPLEHRRARDGFKLTDRRMKRMQVLDQVDYCMYCHERDKDTCSKGFIDAKLSEANGKPTVKKNPLGIPLEGCPLEEKISEMHLVRRQGEVIGALAIICVDNPMLAGTGHRICNDCMKGCIYQKQEPVNIPQIETSVLTDVLALPYGFEIYSLLTRWNPLHVKRPHALPYNGKNVLVVGMGPAGYTLAHHLANEGFGVIGIDGLKIEPAPIELAGDPDRGILPKPLRDFASIDGELDERILTGFGGVSEYGITVRWDKNFLDVLRVLIARRDRVRIFGGVRLGGTLTLEDAWQMGFHHVGIAAGAGKPTIIDIENNLIRGIRKASDFLMALQLQGAFKKSSLANLQVRLPAIVIGGGLTAIDTATELLAYYIVQVEKTLDRFEHLASAGQDVLALMDKEERVILEESLVHGRAVREERRAAKAAGRAPNFQPLLDGWGGCSLVYRKSLADSPAYRLNHEEIIQGFEEGIRIVEKMAPRKAVPDEFGALKSVIFERQSVEKTPTGEKWRATGELVELPARTMCIAAGTSPNTIYEKEFPGSFKLDRKGFFSPHKAVRKEDGAVELTPSIDGFFTSYNHEGHLVSYYGDNHPKYAGSVVRAMASAKHGYVAVTEALVGGLTIDPALQPQRDAAWTAFSRHLTDELSATVHEVIRLTPTIVEVVVRAPLAARKFKPGQFYRFQNFESRSPLIDGTRLTMEGLALTGAWTDPERGLLSMIILEMGSSSRLCAYLQPGEPVVVMGPTGTPTEIPHGETIALIGGGLGNAVLFSIGRAMRAAGNKIIYFAGYKKPGDVYHRDEIEAAADQVVWCIDPGSGEPILPRRPQDRHYVANIVETMMAYAQKKMGGEMFDLSTVDRIVAIGSDRMMAAVKRARHAQLAPYLKAKHIGIGSINSPMQCMMKEVCAQCLQKHVDPVTGKESIVFTCFNQDQELDAVDFDNLAARLRLNSVQEKLTNAWLSQIVEKFVGESEEQRRAV